MLRQVLGYGLCAGGALIGLVSTSEHWLAYFVPGAVLLTAGILLLVVDEYLLKRKKKVDDASDGSARRS